MPTKKYLQLRAARTRLGLTLRDLEKKVGVSRQALSLYERGVHPPLEVHWLKIKQVLNLKGTVEEWWGRAAHIGMDVKYDENSTCKVEGCDEMPVAKGYCRRHYNQHSHRVRMQSERLQKRAKGSRTRG